MEDTNTTKVEDSEFEGLSMGRPESSEANQKRINEVEYCFGIDGQPLSAPGRFLIGQGTLMKVCRKKHKPRKFFLFNDILVYGKVLIDNKKYFKQHIIPLEDIKVESLEDTDEMKNAWQIKGKSKSFVVYGGSAEDKKEWVSYINICINDKLQESGKKSTAIHAPVWIPDAKAQDCMLCRITFSVINRRHHCRSCGKVVCDRCSNKKIELQSDPGKLERVCRWCFVDLSVSKTDFNNHSERFDNLPDCHE